ncbi:12219_t:CDS:2 [Acaulospora colombiana]|uniref:12219_t:CDS:1 n=1 Tax=Acaulospora colombiana TaxID=27376 RepID=A0ACA9LK58_9GLOM|nr:12219_t:CDS:2 [Acaulospora colombiana]
MMVIGLGTNRDLNEHVTTSPASPSSPQSTHSRQNSTGTTTVSSKQLSKTLLTLLTAKSQAGVWELGKSASTNFHAVAVDKNHQFPPRKPAMRPSQTPHHSTIPAHSPLSPYTPGSPVHPDGLIPAIWVRKHREIIPSVVVGFYDLWHRSMVTTTKEKDELTLQEPLGSLEPIEKEKDSNLALEINEKRKSLHERGIRFAAVIILRTQHMEEQMTEERLGNIRKASGLDAKNCFMVLTPSAHVDLPEYVSNSTKEYISQESQPLSVQGWMIRYDYKMATFAEFRQEMDAAINTSSTDNRFSSNNNISSTGINPSVTLQHPGFYYYLAAKYNSMKRKKFLELEKNFQRIDNSKIPPSVIDAERNVEHSTFTIELLTKSYEQFKKQKTGRMTLYLASEIAETYFEAEKYDMALK